MFQLENIKIGIVGLGYVGLPLAIAFAEKYTVTGYDINTTRITELNKGIDETGEVSSEDLNKADKLNLSCSLKDLANCTVYIITVPTLINQDKEPDFKFLYNASETIASLLKKGDTVIYESTVYPGATEEECIPILEQLSGLTLNKDFFVGYSPERINPGDKKNTLKTIVKLTSGSNEATRIFVDELYGSIITAGTYSVSSIKVAEAAKVIENTQRDINIAFVNELSQILAPMAVSTQEVLAAAGTKWNFLKFTPGLVGGHCIGINPYFLSYKSTSLGYTPQLILNSRRINEGMPLFVAEQIILHLAKRQIAPSTAKLLILGTSFKENCPDVRNSKVLELIEKLAEYKVQLTVFDPIVVGMETVVADIAAPPHQQFDCIVLAVAHNEFLLTNWSDYLSANGFIYDIKGFLPVNSNTIRL